MYFRLKSCLVLMLALAVIWSVTGAYGADSSTVTVNGREYILAEAAWDVDFEGEHAGTHRWGAPYVSIFDTATSATLSNSLGNSLTAHAGSTANSIVTADTGNIKYGTALKMAANDDSQVQLNEFMASPTGDIVVFEWDYMLRSLPESSAAAVTVMEPVMQSDSWISSLSVKLDSEKPYFAMAGGKTLSFETGEWHNIRAYVDTVNDKVSYLIDGENLGDADVSASAQSKGKKVVSKLSGAKGAEAWIDNFKCYSLNRLPSVVSVQTEGCDMKVEFSSPIDVGNFVSEGAIQNITLKYKDKNIKVISCTATDNDKILSFGTSAAIPTGVKLDMDIGYLGAHILCSFESSPAAADVKNVSVVQEGASFTATATGYNITGAERSVIMIMTLYDSRDRVVAVSYGAPASLVTSENISVSASSEKAAYAKVFFMTDWQSSKPFKNIVYP